MEITIDISGISLSSASSQQVSTQDLNAWVKACLAENQGDTELSIQIVGPEEGKELNRQYRGKNAATNVLSFPAELHEAVTVPLIGDLVICADIVKREAEEQNKILKDHWAHMIIHGTLHLLGHDHIEEKEAETMERLEINIMRKLGLPNPYLTQS